MSDHRQLTETQADLLREVIAWTRPQLTHPVAALLAGQLGTRADVEAIRTSLGYEQYTSGVDADYEPNERGRELEAIIDWLSTRIDPATIDQVN